MSSPIRQNFSPECETLANKVISLRQQTATVYQALAAFYQRDDQQPLKGFEMHFWRRADKVEMDARRLMRFVNHRGGRVQFQTIPKPQVTEWQTPVEALQLTLQMEQQIQTLVIQLVETALKTQDPITRQIEHFFLQKQTKLIKKIANTLTILRRNGHGLGAFSVDKHIMTPLEHKRLRNIVIRLPKTTFPIVNETQQNWDLTPRKMICRVPCTVHCRYCL